MPTALPVSPTDADPLALPDTLAPRTGAGRGRWA